MKKIHYEKTSSGVIALEYDTDHIKDFCVDCDYSIKNPEQNYLVRGNFCPECNAKYGKLPSTFKLQNLW
jgi:hypothetical protein